VVATALSACGSGEPQEHRPVFGVNYTERTLSGRDLDRMSKAGIERVRWMFLWPEIESPTGQFVWARTDQVVGDLASRGISVLPVLYGTPEFVGRAVNDPPLDSNAARREWRRFVTAVVDRYGPGGDYWTNVLLYPRQHPDRPPLPVRSWQVWNEPNLKSHFLPRPSPPRYAQLLRISSQAINAEDPGATVVLAGMPGYSGDIDGWRFLDGIYRTRGISGDFDAVALHPYSKNVRTIGVQAERMRDVMAKHGDARTPLWITELGWGSAPPNRFGLTKGKEGQKRELEEAFRALEHRSRAWHIPQVFWYDFRDSKNAQGCSFCSSAGLLKQSGRPKPSWHAFQQFAGPTG
jgi:hypothetical protein